MRAKSGAFGAVLGELGSLDWLAFRAKGGAYGAATVGLKYPPLDSVVCCWDPPMPGKSFFPSA